MDAARSIRYSGTSFGSSSRNETGTFARSDSEVASAEKSSSPPTSGGVATAGRDADPDAGMGASGRAVLYGVGAAGDCLLICY